MTPRNSALPAMLILALPLWAANACANDVQRVLCYGDSITAAENGWVSIVDDDEAVEAINAGRGGRRAVNARKELLPYLTQHANQHLDRILLCLGVNDLPARDPRPGETKVAICVQGMREAIDLSLQTFSADQIVLVAPCGVNPATMNQVNKTKGYQITQPLLEKLEKEYRKLAQEKNVHFISLLRAVSDANFVDGLHPSRAGHEEIASVLGAFLSQIDRPLRLWYAKPAREWSEALPIGNGHMGAMVFGGLESERIQFNDDTLWRGKPHNYVRRGAGDQLKKIQELIFSGKAEQAQDLAREKFLSDPVRQMPYQPFGDLRLHFPDHGAAQDYYRDLNLDKASASVRYRIGDVTYSREIFASYPDRAIVMRVTASQPGKINLFVNMESPHKDASTRVADGDLVMSGKVQADGLAFESRLRAKLTSGIVKQQKRSLEITGADSVTLVLVTATSFNNFQDISGDPSARAAERLDQVASRDYDSLWKRHYEDYRALFQRVQLHLGTRDQDRLPTDLRWERVKQNGLESDSAFAALYFQYGRYLLISCSRPGSQPANLQGVWNELLDPPWESKYTLNINCEMNYWPAQVCNLPECQEPLFDMIDDLVLSGSRTATQQYNARGWVVHHNTDLWRGTAPINNIDGIWPAGGAWLSHHLWDHYLYTSDKEFLADRAYPAMKGAALFFVDLLVEDPETGYFVTNPSHSPEQSPPDKPLLRYAPTIDNQLIRAVFRYVIQAAKILEVDADLAKNLQQLSNRLPPNQIGRHGQLQEWFHDLDEPKNRHRHMSPLWALFPGCDITPEDAEIYQAAKVLLDWRGDGDTGWSYAWRMSLWARVQDGDMAHRQLYGLLNRRTLPNLFDLCGPFQIDGNFGACAGVAEMLLQSHLTQTADRSANDLRVINLLPALPKAWPSGSVRGLLARGGFKVDIDWRGGRLTRALVRSRQGGVCSLRYRNTMQVVQVESDNKPLLFQP